MKNLKSKKVLLASLLAITLVGLTSYVPAFAGNVKDQSLSYINLPNTSYKMTFDIDGHTDYSINLSNLVYKNKIAQSGGVVNSVPLPLDASVVYQA